MCYWGEAEGDLPMSTPQVEYWEKRPVIMSAVDAALYRRHDASKYRKMELENVISWSNSAQERAPQSGLVTLAVRDSSEVDERQ